MSHHRKSLIDIVTRLGHLLERPALTDNEQQDRRVIQSLSGSIPCNFCCRERFYSGIVKNLSIDGAFVASDDSPPLHSIGNFVFESEGGVTMKVPSMVVHPEESSQVEGFELDFISISEGNQELLEAITSEQSLPTTFPVTGYPPRRFVEGAEFLVGAAIHTYLWRGIRTALCNG